MLQLWRRGAADTELVGSDWGATRASPAAQTGRHLPTLREARVRYH